MNLSAEQIQSNWGLFLDNIENYITGVRSEKLLAFYKKFEERIILMPAAHKKEYHNAFPGGYVEHVNRVVRCALKQYELWKEAVPLLPSVPLENIVCSAINNDLGKMGSIDQASYIPQTDKWRREKLGEDYMFNKEVPFSSVPDRGLWLLQHHDIKYSFNEMVAIQTHDGLYDPANEKYLKAYMPEQKPRTSLPFILHQADLMAARIEFEREWLPKFKKDQNKPKDNFTIKNKKTTKSKALGNISSPGLKNMLDNL